MTLKEKGQILSQVVYDQLGFDVFKDTRKRNVVDARRIYSKILFDKGYGYTEIGRTLGKNHATIMHYLRHFDVHILYSKTLKEGLQKVSYAYDLVLSDEAEEDRRSRTELITLNQRLAERIESLLKENESLKKEINEIRKKRSRHYDLYNIIETRVNSENENLIKVKLNHLLNGLQV